MESLAGEFHNVFAALTPTGQLLLMGFCLMVWATVTLLRYVARIQEARISDNRAAIEALVGARMALQEHSGVLEGLAKQVANFTCGANGKP